MLGESIAQYIEYKLLALAYKILNVNGREYLRDFLELYKTNRS